MVGHLFTLQEAYAIADRLVVPDHGTGLVGIQYCLVPTMATSTHQKVHHFRRRYESVGRRTLEESRARQV